jgi:hypothetical protein
VDHEDKDPKTSHDEQITHELFVKLNRESLGIPGDRGLDNICDYEDREEDIVGIVPANAPPILNH